MAGGEARGPKLLLETDRFLLRPWRVPEAFMQPEMWAERDPRVPPHRRIDANGCPTVAAFEEAIRAAGAPSPGLLAVEPKGLGRAVGYCGLVKSGRGAQRPELTFEFLRRSWGHGVRNRGGVRSDGLGEVGWVRATLGHGLGLEHALTPRAREGRIHKDGTRGDPPRDHRRFYATALSGARTSAAPVVDAPTGGRLTSAARSSP